MPNLNSSLQDHDLGHLKIIASKWGVDLEAPDLKSARKSLQGLLENPGLVEEVFLGLRPESQEALLDLVKHSGRQVWIRFSQLYGEIRSYGPARRDRERPDLNPQSVAETLFYFGLIGRAFFDTADGPIEHAYIPEELLRLLPPIHPQPEEPFGRPAPGSKKAATVHVTEVLLEHLTTLLAALRIGLPVQKEGQSELNYFQCIPIDFLTNLLKTLDLLNKNDVPNPETTREFFERAPNAALSEIVGIWLKSSKIDELRLLPLLQVEGEWAHDPVRSRSKLIGLIHTIPEDTWWSVPGFIASIKSRYPHFLRPSGEFDSWYLRDESSGEYFRGIENWDRVEGAWLNWMIAGPMHWLGLLDLQYDPEDFSLQAFKVSAWASDLLNGRPPALPKKAAGKVHIRSDGQIRIPVEVGRGVRYQLARFGSWEIVDQLTFPLPTPHEYRYRLSPSALSRASDQGLQVNHLIAMLARNSDGIPPNVTKVLKNWSRGLTGASIQTFPVLRLPEPEALKALQASRAARFLGDILGPTAVIVKPGAEDKVLDALIELGYLGEIRS